MKINIGTVADVKKIFFDPVEVMRKAKQAEKISLSRVGSYIRQVAQNKIKTAKNAVRSSTTEKGKYRKTKEKMISAPGQPPLSHTGKLKRGILFGYDPTGGGVGIGSVVVGPTLLPSSGKNPPDAPEMLEYGGTTRRKGKPAKYSARPFMGPARADSEPLDRFWKDSITA